MGGGVSEKKSTGSGRVGLLIASTLLALVAAEVVVRSCFTFMPSIQIGEGATRASDEMVRRIFEPDPELIWRRRRNLVEPDEDVPFRGVISNAQRLRERDEVPLEKDANEVRVLFLGDSVTFGWRLDIDDTFVERTERTLGERFPGKRIRCINAGVPAYSLLQGWRLLETEGFGFEPDLVVASFGPNDLTSWGGSATSNSSSGGRRSSPATRLPGVGSGRSSRYGFTVPHLTRSTHPVRGCASASSAGSSNGFAMRPVPAGSNSW
jgi:hypothetical protein